MPETGRDRDESGGIKKIKLREEDTIAAISTPVGPGGIGIVRISGSDSFAILNRIFLPSKSFCTFDSHHLYHGFVIDPGTGQEIDEALCVYMKAPRTYTREDVVEIQCHAGYAVITRILDICIASGARHAEPGEFTMRAFLNGRIDLVQAEAVLDLAGAEATGLASMGISAVQGRLSERIGQIKYALVASLAAMEVAIDYPEEDSEILKDAELEAILETQVIQPLETMVNDYNRTRIHRFGANVMLTGRPNAGKSSLLNALSCEDRAIVTDIPGTTRDVVEARIDIGGAAVTLMDTAGVRDRPDPIEEMGIRRIREIAPDVQLFLWLIDISRDLESADMAVMEMLEDFRQKPVIIVFNKVDLLEGGTQEQAEKILGQIGDKSRRLSGSPYCMLSAVEGKGLEALQTLMKDALFGQEATLPDVAPNLRQKEIMEKTLAMVRQALEGLCQGLSSEMPALDIRQALDYLGNITGETATDDIMEQIFSRFCLGK